MFWNGAMSSVSADGPDSAISIFESYFGRKLLFQEAEFAEGGLVEKSHVVIRYTGPSGILTSRLGSVSQLATISL